MDIAFFIISNSNLPADDIRLEILTLNSYGKRKKIVSSTVFFLYLKEKIYELEKLTIYRINLLRKKGGVYYE